jgi:hypothetical protein
MTTLRTQFTAILALLTLLTGCMSTYSYRPADSKPETVQQADTCITECARGPEEDYQSCLEACPSLVKESGPCEDEEQVCTQDDEVSVGKTVVGSVLGGVVITGVLVAVAVGSMVATLDDICKDSDTHC